MKEAKLIKDIEREESPLELHIEMNVNFPEPHVEGEVVCE
jgi:hypothetical protein